MCIAIECSYKLDQKNEFKFLCEPAMRIFANPVTYMHCGNVLMHIMPNIMLA